LAVTDVAIAVDELTSPNTTSNASTDDTEERGTFDGDG
jgi:hypothetical protein